MTVRDRLKTKYNVIKLKSSELSEVNDSKLGAGVIGYSLVGYFRHGRH